MARRANFKDIGHGLLQSFISRNNSVDGYWALGKLFLLARRHETSRLSLNLWGDMPGESLDAELAEIRMRYASWLSRALQRHALPESWLKSATATLEFERHDLHAVARARGYLDAPPFLCTIHLVDDLSREYRFEAVGGCWPHDPLREMQSATRS